MRYLITTADERTWPKDQPVLFLGEWCKRFSRKKNWSSLDSNTVTYHWDDRKQLQEDSLYLQDIYENLLEELSEYLNISVHLNTSEINKINNNVLRYSSE